MNDSFMDKLHTYSDRKPARRSPTQMTILRFIADNTIRLEPGNPTPTTAVDLIHAGMSTRSIAILVDAHLIVRDTGFRDGNSYALTWRGKTYMEDLGEMLPTPEETAEIIKDKALDDSDRVKIRITVEIVGELREAEEIKNRVFRRLIGVADDAHDCAVSKSQKTRRI